MKAGDGKLREIDILNTKGILRLIDKIRERQVNFDRCKKEQEKSRKWHENYKNIESRYLKRK